MLIGVKCRVGKKSKFKRFKLVIAEVTRNLLKNKIIEYNIMLSKQRLN